MSESRPLALTHSAWINAWTLYRACAALGFDLRVDVDRREIPLPRRSAGSAANWLFFTEEWSLARALATPGERPRFWPQTFPPELLDDKFAFADWLRNDAAGPRGLPQWPITEPAAARWPLLLKARHSWRGERKLPRGWVCRDTHELQTALARLPDAEHEWYFLQQWFGDSPMRLLSVAGFFDAQSPERNLAAVTERLTAYGAGPSSTAMLATIDDELGLVGMSERVLKRIEYRGPYELEFVVTARNVYVLELNPRFWMQHGLFLLAGNGLVKRYLNLDDATDYGVHVLKSGSLWTDGFWLLRQIARGNFAVWRQLRAAQKMGHAVVCPPLGTAMRTVVWRVLGGR